MLALLEPLLPLDLDERLDLSPLMIGIVFAAGDIAYFVSIAPAGRWSDRHGRRLPTLAGGLMVAAFLPFTAIGPAWFVALAFVGVGAGLAGLGASSGALMVEAVDQAGMAGRYGLSAALLTSVFSAGYVLGPLLGAAASAMMPYSATVTLAAALCRWRPRGSRAPSRAIRRRPGFGPWAKGKGAATLIPSPSERARGAARWSPCSPITRPTATSTRCSRSRTGRASPTSASSAG